MPINPIELRRQYFSDATLSHIVFDAGFALYGVERTETDPTHPCIPEGEYTLEPHHGPKASNGPIWAMVNESFGVFHEPHGTGRFACLFGHIGNYPKDVEGCVAFGLLEQVHPVGMVLESRIAVQRFQEWMTKNWNPSITLIITS